MQTKRNTDKGKSLNVRVENMGCGEKPVFFLLLESFQAEIRFVNGNLRSSFAKTFATFAFPMLMNESVNKYLFR